MKKIRGVIITGATGTIGISLTRLFADKNIPVLAVIRRNSSRRKYIEGLPNVRIEECNLADLSNLSPDDPTEYNILFHLAWEGSGRESRNSREVQERNVSYIPHVIEFARKLGCDTFVGAGSQAEYGRVNGIIDENYSMNPITEYGRAKLAAEILSRNICKEKGIHYIWTRIFSVYGPGMGMDSLITYSLYEILNGKSPKMTPGEQIWDYMYSDDAANALYLLALNGKPENVYCISGGAGKTVREYVEIIRDVVNPSVKLQFGDVSYQDNQVMELIGDISKLKKDTGFASRVSFEDGIKKMCNWMKNEIQ